MKHLIHTFLAKSSVSELVKYEIYSDSRKLDYFGKVPEGTCRVISYGVENGIFKLLDSDVDVQPLFDANRPDPNTWYSDGNDRVNLEMLIKHLEKIA